MILSGDTKRRFNKSKRIKQKKMIEIFTQDYVQIQSVSQFFQYQFQTNSTQEILKIKWQNQYKRTKEIEN